MTYCSASTAPCMPSGLLSVKPEVSCPVSWPPQPAARAESTAAATAVRTVLRSAATAHACGELSGQRRERAETGTTVRAGVEQPAHESRPDDHAVGVAGDL